MRFELSHVIFTIIIFGFANKKLSSKYISFLRQK